MVGMCPVFKIFKSVVVFAFFLAHGLTGTTSNTLAIVDVGGGCLIIDRVGASTAVAIDTKAVLATDRRGI